MWELGDLLRGSEPLRSSRRNHPPEVRAETSVPSTLRSHCARIRTIWPSVSTLRSECWNLTSTRNVFQMLPLLDSSTRRKYRVTRAQLSELRSAMIAFAPREFIPMLRRFKWKHRL